MLARFVDWCLVKLGLKALFDDLLQELRESNCNLSLLDARLRKIESVNKDVLLGLEFDGVLLGLQETNRRLESLTLLNRRLQDIETLERQLLQVVQYSIANPPEIARVLLSESDTALRRDMAELCLELKHSNEHLACLGKCVRQGEGCSYLIVSPKSL